MSSQEIQPPVDEAGDSAPGSSEQRISPQRSRRALTVGLVAVGILVLIVALSDPVSHLLSGGADKSPEDTTEQSEETPVRRSGPKSNAGVITLEVLLLGALAICIATPLVLGRRKRRRRSAGSRHQGGGSSADLVSGVEAAHEVGASPGDS